MELILLAVVAASAIAALLVTPLIRAVALKTDFVDHPGERKIHSRAVAYGGGIAVALAMGLAVLAAIPFAREQATFPRAEQIPASVILVLALGPLGALFLGLADDRYKLTPFTKLALQFLLAIGAVAGGVRITALIGDFWYMKALTVLWIVLITNSFNLLDNMDGLCAGVVAISSAVLGLVALEGGQWTYALLLAALCGASLGFMKYNRAPATIFLGDGGSLFAGFLMACFTVLVTYYRYKEPSHLAVGIPILVLAIPLYDTFSVIVIRIREGRPIMRGDTSHFSHRLVDLGMTRRQAVATIHLACLAIGLPATVLGQLSEARGFLIIGQAVLVLTIVALLERAGRNRAARRSAEEKFGIGAPDSSTDTNGGEPAAAKAPVVEVQSETLS